MYGGDNYKIAPSYYRPYKSDSDLEDEEDDESKSTTTNESEYSSTSSHEPDYSSPKALVKAAGISLHTTPQQLKYDIGFKYDGRYTSYGTYDHEAAAAATASAVLSNQPVINYGGTKLETKTGTTNSLIVVNSRDRDRQVFPQPTSVTLRLPRVYKNITALQFSQIKLLSAFYYFRPDKGNTTFFIKEAGRSFILQEGIPSGYPLDTNGFPITIEPGSYDINGLIKELNRKLNTYPIFYYFPNGINDFAQNLEITGDLGLNFNQVGDYYYDILNKIYVTSPQLTITYVTQNFFVSRYPNQTSFNTIELYTAYYYPPLKLYLLQHLSDYSAIDLTLTTSASSLLPGQTPLTRVLYYFQGLDDPVVAEVIKNNLTFLDNFRTLNTFQYTPVNKYNVSLDTTQNVITFTSPNLNTSLVTLIQNQYSNSFLNELANRGVSQPNYATSNAYLQQFNAVLLSMYNYLQSALANVFAVNYDTYTLEYLAQSNWQIYIRNGTDANNINNNISLNINNIMNPLSNFSLQVEPPLGTWSNLSSNLTNPYTFVNNTQFNLYYNIGNNTLTSSPIIDPVTSNIITDNITNSADVVVPVIAEKYTVFAFTSPVRQTLQVETLSRPLKYRYPAYNSNNIPANVANIFNYTYQYIDNTNFDASLPRDYVQESGNTWSNVLCNITGTQFAQSYAQGFSNGQKFIQTCGPFTVFNTIFYTFTAPLVSNSPANSVNKYPVTFSIIGNGPNSNDITILMYHDRAAMMGDIPVLFNENSNNYKISFTSTLSPQSSNISISWNAYENNTYYIVVRPATIPFSFSAFSVIPVITFPNSSNYTSFSTLVPSTFDPTIDPTTDPYFHSNFNYAQIYDPDWIRLPTSSTLWGQSPSDNPNNTPITVSPPPIGYDINGNSFDLTDYRPYSKYTTQTVLSTQYCFDPIGPHFDIFRFNSPYNRSNQSYFYTGSSNFIFSGSNQVAITTPGTIASRQYKLLNWFDLNYIGPVITNNLSNINSTFTKNPFTLASTSNTPIGGYIYDTNSNLSLYDGVSGFTFLPDDGIWNLTSLSFNSAVMNKSNNTNHLIAYIGIYNTADVYNTEFLNISLSSARIKLSLTSRRYYLPSQANNPGFSNEYLLAPDEYVFDNPNITYGSYYTFSTQASNTLTGHTESPQTFLNTPVGLYSAIAFNAAGQVVTISQLAGSLVPYPLAGYSVPLVSNAYLDGNSTQNGKQLIVPSQPNASASLPEGVDYTQVGFQQSMYFTTTAVHMLNYTQQIYDNAAMRQWSIASNIPLQGPIKGISAKIQNTLIVSALNSSSVLIYNVYTYQGNSYNYQLNFQYSFSNMSTSAPPSYTPVSIALLATNTTSVYYLSYSGTDLFIYGWQGSPYHLNYASLITTTTISSSEIPQQMSVDNNGDILFSTYNSANSTYTLYYMPAGGSISQYTVASSVINPHVPIYFDLELDPVNERSASVILSSNILTTFRVTDFSGHHSSSTISNYTPSLSNIMYVLEGSAAAYYSLTSNNYWAQIQIQGGGTANQVTSYQQLPQTTVGLVSGAGASKWIVTTSNIYGNRYLIDGTLETAWQIFYPSYKFIFTKTANTQVQITNNAFIEPPEYFHTNLFVYNSLSTLSNDIWGKWGAENPSNYLCADTQFRGYQFNSYIENVPLESNQTYYIALRGYTPSEQFETMVRFNLPNRYDFGWIAPIDIINEALYVSAYQAASSNNSLPLNFNPDYVNALSNFNQIFVGVHNYGGYTLSLPCFSGVSSNPYAGSNNPYNQTGGNWGGFPDLYFAFIILYAQYVPINNLVNGVNSVAQAGVSNFIGTQLSNILPLNNITNSQYTSPLLYSLLFGSGNTYASSNLIDEWGIGWNLGFPKVDTPLLTIQTGTSFYKILDDYIYVKLNPEYPINCLDTTGAENLQITRESTGNVKGYNMKLLLNNFGGYAQTAILNPVVLNPPISRMDKLTLQLLDLNGTVLNNANCEWNGCLQITEALDQPTQDSSIIKLNVTQDVDAINN